MGRIKLLENSLGSQGREPGFRRDLVQVWAAVEAQNELVNKQPNSLLE